jgi:hypothetical protein
MFCLAALASSPVKWTADNCTHVAVGRSSKGCTSTVITRLPVSGGELTLLVLQPIHRAHEVLELDGGGHVARQRRFELAVDPGHGNAQR